MQFWVHDSKSPCTRQQIHAPRVQGAPLISDTVLYTCVHILKNPNRIPVQAQVRRMYDKGKYDWQNSCQKKA